MIKPHLTRMLLSCCIGMLSVVVMLLLVAPPRVVQAESPAPALVIVDGTYADLRTVRREIVRSGGRVQHIFPPDTLIAELSPEQVQTLSRQPLIKLVSYEAVPVSTKAEFSNQAAIGVWNMVYHEKLPAPPENEKPFFDDVLLPPQPPDQERPVEGDASAASPEPGYYDTSLFLSGDVVIAFVLPESNGIAEPSTEDWITTEVASVQSTSVAGMNRWVQAEPNAAITFIYVWTDAPPTGGISYTVSTDYEAETHSNFDTLVINSFMAHLGYTNTNAFTNIRDYLNDLRGQYAADWAYLVQVRDDTSSCGRASAYLGGPATTLYDCDLRSGNVLAHESGHIFRAGDEYCPDACQSPIGRYGYQNVVNANSAGPSGTGGPGYFAGKGEALSSMMLNNSGVFNPYTRGQVGWRDADGDGILDIHDTYPDTTWLTSTISAAITVSGQATVVPLRGMGNDVSLDSIAGVEVRLNELTWLPATAADGAFSSPTETFRLIWPLLPNGVYTVEARARNDVGNVERSLARTTFTITASPVTNANPFAAFEITPSRANLSTAFALDARASTDLEGQALQVRWDWQNDGTWDTSFSSTLTATHQYTQAGGVVIAAEVQDSLGATSLTTHTVEVVGTNTAPVPFFTVVGGDARFGIITPTFTFDPSGSHDAETAPTNLAFRWDWDGNGTWDTSWITGPVTMSNTYTLTAQGKPDGLPRSNQWRVNLMVRDANGATATTSRHIWANPYDHAPVATGIFSTSAWHTAGPLPFDFRLSSDADLTQTWDSLLEYQFDWDDDGNWDTDKMFSTTAAALKLTTPGVYPVVMQVSDRFGAASTLSQTITIFPPPDLAIPSSLQAVAFAGQSVQQTLGFTNSGVYTGALDLEEVALGITSPYTIDDTHNGSLHFNWRSTWPGDIMPRAADWHGTAPPRDADDEGYVGPIDLSFPFPFYGQVYTQVYAAANGYLSFAPPPADFGNGTIPTATLPNGLISAFWSDLNLGIIATTVPTDGVGVFHYNPGTAEGAFVAEYNSAEIYGHTDWSLNTFQIVLLPNGTILLQYSYAPDTPASPIGIEHPAGTTGLTYTLPFTKPVAVAFVPEQTDIPWLTLSPPSGTAPGGSSASIVATFDATALVPGIYTGRLLVYSNDPDTPFANLPVTFTVQPFFQLWLPVVLKE